MATKKSTTKLDDKSAASALPDDASAGFARHEVAFITHFDNGLLAIPSEQWIDDPNSSEMVTTYSITSDPRPCVETNYNDVVRAGLAYVGRMQAAQCQQDPLAKTSWVIARRRL